MEGQDEDYCKRTHFGQQFRLGETAEGGVVVEQQSLWVGVDRDRVVAQVAQRQETLVG